MLDLHISYVESFFRALGIASPNELSFDALAHAINATFRYAPICSHTILMKHTNLCSIDTRLTRRQRRVVEAHELAHVILHSGDQRKMVDSYRLTQETTATRLAGHIFAPTYLLLKYLPEAPPYYETSIAYLARVFRVTYEAMRARLDELRRTSFAAVAETAAAYSWGC